MLNYTKLQITYCNPDNHHDQVKIDYVLRDSNIAKKWVNQVLLAQKLNYPIDQPRRFYGFGTIEQQTASALLDMNKLLDKLENFWRIPIGRRLQDVGDQDTLNYLHHIFEVEHGLLNQKKLNPQFQKHISQLNILVHRCESVARGALPRHVVTYFGLPKTETLSEDDYQHFTPKIKFGTVYINYVEIGKTLLDFMIDNDQYIDPSAFRPFTHYSADFVVKFWDSPNEDLHDRLHRYFQKNEHFFTSIGYTWDKLSKSIGLIPVADLDDNYKNILSDIESRQFVKAVEFS